MPHDLVQSQTDRIERIRRIDGWSIAAMLLALTTIGLVAAGMRLGRRSVVPSMIVILALGVAQLLGAQLRMDWRKMAVVLALALMCGLLLWLPGAVAFGVIAPVVVALLWFFVYTIRSRETSLAGEPGSEQQTQIREKIDSDSAPAGILRRTFKRKNSSRSWTPDDIGQAVRLGVVMVVAVALSALILSCKQNR